MRKQLATALTAAVLFATGAGKPSSSAAPAGPIAPRTNLAVAAAVPATTPRLLVLFSPGGGCTEAIVDGLGKARTSIDVQAYSFTSAPIAEAVGKAFARGV